ncbi:alpha-galactosidase, partial [Klebsiella michiganensis]|uniref:alpha-galactosidase n=1 Tax=Klebsiella michiganensis TaxID=1134687 RepID=UPI001E6087E6
CRAALLVHLTGRPVKISYNREQSMRESYKRHPYKMKYRIGVERFIIDDGWFKGRNDDWAALGDWYLDEKKYPDGLTPVIDH